MATKPAKGLLTSKPTRSAARQHGDVVFAPVIIAIAFTGFFSAVRLWGEAGGEVLGESGVFITTLSCLSTLTFVGRLAWMVVAKCRGTLYPAAWTSAALAPERSVVLGGLILIVFAGVLAFRCGPEPDLPESLAPLVVGAFFGFPLVEVFVTQANSWRLFVTDRDPD